MAEEKNCSDDITVDQCIELAAALERQRAIKIVDAVAALPFAQADTPFAAGYSLACEEIKHRIEAEEWTLGQVPTPLPAA